MTQIDYFFSTASPYTYLAGLRLEEIAARHGATIFYKPVDLGALFPGPAGLRCRNDIRRGKPIGCRNCDGRRQRPGCPSIFSPATGP